MKHQLKIVSSPDFSESEDDQSLLLHEHDASDKWLNRNERNRRKKDNKRKDNGSPADQSQFKKRDKKTTPKSRKK